MVDAILTQNLLPRMAHHFLLAATGEPAVQRLELGVQDSDFVLHALLAEARG